MVTNEELPPDLSDPEEKQRFPWLIIIGIVVVTAIFGSWLMHSRAQQDTVSAKLQQDLAADKVILDQARDKVFDLTKQLETLKQQITLHQAADPKAAVATYNALAAEQRTQRETVKTLADQYNQKVAKLHELQ